MSSTTNRIAQAATAVEPAGPPPGGYYVAPDAYGIPVVWHERWTGDPRPMPVLAQTDLAADYRGTGVWALLTGHLPTAPGDPGRPLRPSYEAIVRGLTMAVAMGHELPGGRYAIDPALLVAAVGGDMFGGDGTKAGYLAALETLAGGAR